MKYVRFLDIAGFRRCGKLIGHKIVYCGIEYDLDEIRFLPPSDPSKIVCIGLNYADHAEETGKEVPDRPKLFLKPPNSLSAHLDTVKLLEGKERIDHEAELAVIIGEQCRNVDIEEAMNYVSGYTCLNDLSNRDDQRIEQNWIRGKAFDNSAPCGPVLATVDEVPDDASIESRLNGEVKQSSTIDNLIFSVPELIEEITTYMTLEQGDIISTGTPAGVGPISSGDVVEIEIEGIGVLKNYFE